MGFWLRFVWWQLFFLMIYAHRAKQHWILPSPRALLFWSFQGIASRTWSINRGLSRLWHWMSSNLYFYHESSMFLLRCTYWCLYSCFSVDWCSFVFRVNLTLFYDQVFVLNLPMYLKLFTITSRTRKQLLTSPLTCFRCSHFTLWLLFRVMQVFRCQTRPHSRSISLLS